MSKCKISASETVGGCIKWIRNWFEENGKGCNAIIGISGGKDSTVAAKLCVEALGKDRVIGIMMPKISNTLLGSAVNAIDSLLYEYKTQISLDDNVETINKYISAINALKDGYKVCQYLGIKHYVVNISDAYESIINRIGKIPGENGVSEQTKINLSPRLRMSTLYAVAQSMNGRVVNTSNASELYVGYGTRWGDVVGDVAPLANFTCTEVKTIGKILGIPDEFVNRAPDDGLCGKTDEESFGFTYAELDSYIRDENVSYDRAASIVAAIDEMHKKSEFKRKPIASYVFGE